MVLTFTGTQCFGMPSSIRPMDARVIWKWLSFSPRHLDSESLWQDPVSATFILVFKGLRSFISCLRLSVCQRAYLAWVPPCLWTDPELESTFLAGLLWCAVSCFSR